MKKFQRVVAIIVVILLLSIYGLSIYAAFSKKPYSGSLLAASLFSTFVVPLFVYAAVMFYRYTHPKDDMTLDEVKKLNKELEQKETSANKNNGSDKNNNC